MSKEMLAIVVGGGPAPGINGVISAATIEAVNQGKEVRGLVGGFRTLFAGDRKSVIPLAIEDVSRIRSAGGSILRTSRDSLENARDHFHTLLATLKRVI